MWVLYSNALKSMTVFRDFRASITEILTLATDWWAETYPNEARPSRQELIDLYLAETKSELIAVQNVNLKL
jgi:hypothetical protein